MRLQRVGHVWATNIFTRNYGPTCHRLDQKKKKKKTTKWLFLICDWVSSGARAPPSTFCPLNACLPESLFQAGRGRKTTKGLCVKDLEVGWEMAHTTLMYKEAGKSSLAAHPRRRGNGLNCTTFTVNYFGCQVQAENVNLRLFLYPCKAEHKVKKCRFYIKVSFIYEFKNPWLKAKSHFCS